jgi:hypothetical protein
MDEDEVEKLVQKMESGFEALTPSEPESRKLLVEKIWETLSSETQSPMAEDLEEADSFIEGKMSFLSLVKSVFKRHGIDG